MTTQEWRRSEYEANTEKTQRDKKELYWLFGGALALTIVLLPFTKSIFG